MSSRDIENPDNVPAVDEAGNSVPNLEALGDLGPDLFNDPGVITADSPALFRHGLVDVLPVRGVEADGLDPDEYIFVPELGDGHVLDGGLALGHEDDGFGSHGRECCSGGACLTDVVWSCLLYKRETLLSAGVRGALWI